MADRFAAAVHVKYPVHRLFRLLVGLVDSLLGLYYVNIFAVNQSSTLCGVTAAGSNPSSSSVGASAPVDVTMLALTYLVRTVRWVGLQSGCWLFISERVEAKLFSIFRCAPKVEPLPTQDSPEIAGVSCASGSAALDADVASRPWLLRDPERRSCASHTHLLRTLSREHTMEGILFAEICNSTVLILIACIQLLYTRCDDPNLIYFPTICQTAQSGADMGTRWLTIATTPVLSLSFALVYVPIFFCLRSVNLGRIGLPIKSECEIFFF
jgi:hypothetical protein